MPTPFTIMLQSLSHQRGVTAALVVSERDGIVIDSNVQVGQSADKVAALAAKLFRQARLSAEAAGLGAVSFMQLEATTGRICAVGSGEQVIVVLAETGVNVGRVRVELLRAAVEVVALGRADFR